jgi:hypothetical protein
MAPGQPGLPGQQGGGGREGQRQAGQPSSDALTSASVVDSGFVVD